MSRVMKPTERAYLDVAKMVLALMFATQRFRADLLPRHFVIITMEDTFPHVLQHMDVFARISKWIVQLQEIDYIILTHQFKEKKGKKEMKSLPLPLPLPVKEIEQAFAL